MKSVPLIPSIIVLFLVVFTVIPLDAQLADPLPETVRPGSLVLELEDWLTIPASASGVPRARISTFRALSDGRIFVCDLRGQLYLIEDRVPSVFLDVAATISDFIDAPGLGTGLQSFDFHPDFATNGKFYTVHSEAWNAKTPDFMGPTAPYNASGQASVLTEWTASDPTAKTFSGTRRELFRVYFPGNIHAMQEIAFNPTATPLDDDYGLLYVCLGEGSSYLLGYASNEHRLDSPMGTIFRIDPMGTNSVNGAYGIPGNNPWADSADASVLKEIFAYGFRNPHRIGWDPATGVAYVGDIGETQVEEVNILVGGHDYGFPEREGTFRLDPTAPQNNDEVFPLPSDDAQYGYTYPVAQYDHDEGIAVVLGPVYRGSRIPELDGRLFFGDIAWGRVFSVQAADLELGKQTPFEEVMLELNGVVADLRSFVGNSRADLRWGTDAEGEIYLMTKTDGKIRKVVGARFQTIGEVIEDPDAWTMAADFESGMGAVAVHPGPDGKVQLSPDSFSAGGNQVLRLLGETFGEIPISNVPSSPAGDGSIYFRFAFAGSGGALRLGASNRDGVDRASQSSVYVLATADGPLEAYDRLSKKSLMTNLRPGVWYEAWALVSGSDGRFSLYVRGDTLTAPALLLGEAQPRLAFGTTGMDRIYLETTAGSGAVLLDDFAYNGASMNIAAPASQSWLLISNFESDEASGNWLSSPQTRSEANGNTWAAFDGASPLTGHVLLPRPIEVSETATLYGRLLVDGTNPQWLGVTNLSGSDLESSGTDGFEAAVRVDPGAASTVQVMDDGSWIPVSGAQLAAGSWYEVWMALRNGGEASGGQTYDVYWREQGDFSAPDKVADRIRFRDARELPLHRVGIVRTASPSGGGYLGLDDLWLALESLVERPAASGVGLFPGSRGYRELPWIGFVWDYADPWIYAAGHEWLYVLSSEADTSWIFDPAIGWLYTGPELYPWLYSSVHHAWLHYQIGTGPLRWFYNTADAEWQIISAHSAL